MKKILILIPLFFWINLNAQTEKEFIPIAVLTETENLGNNESVSNILQNKILEELTKSGLSSTNYSRFIIAPKITVLDKRMTKGTSTAYLLEMSLIIYSADVETETIFSSVSYNFLGADRSVEGAYLNGIKTVKFSDEKFQEFISSTRNRISEYYAANCERILAKSKALSANDIPQSLTELNLIPMSSEDCYMEAQELMREYRLTFVENNCQSQIQKARNIWSAGLNKYAAERAVAIIGNIHHTSSCKSEVNQLMKEISAKLQSDVEYLRELRSQQLQWEKEQERMRLASEEAKRKEMVGLLKAYYRSRPKKIYNTRFLFWR